MSFPNTEVRLLSNVPFSTEHQRTFNSKTDQESYFFDLPSFTFTKFTYQREEQAVKVDKRYDDLYHCNYLMFSNKDYTNKWFYAYITRKQYINPNVTMIYFELDVFQTWQFDMVFNPSFIDREHGDRDSVNTVPENLEIGTEYDVVETHEYESVNNYYLMLTTTDLDVVLNSSTPPDNPPLPKAKMIQGMLTGLGAYVFPDNVDSEGEYQPPQPGDSMFRVPLDEGSYTITSGFGMRNGEPHNGIDFAGDLGDPVYGVEGEVVYASFHTNSDGSDGFGNRVVIKHPPSTDYPNGLWIGYAHLNTINVSVGDYITVDPEYGFPSIGTMGTTGDSTGVHLHYSISTEGLYTGYIDPAPLLGIEV